MIIETKLNNGHGRLLNKSPFLLADNETLTLKFNADIALTETLISARNGAHYVKHRVPNLHTDGWEVPKELYIGGALEIVVEVVVNGCAVRKYLVEPIAIKEESTGFEGYGVLERYDKLIEQTAELSAKCAEFETRLNAMDEFLKRLEDY